MPSRYYQNCKRQFAGCLVLSGCQERHVGKSQCGLSIHKIERGIGQCGLRDLRGDTRRKQE
jgi:hypothetical protein